MRTTAFLFRRLRPSLLLVAALLGAPWLAAQAPVSTGTLAPGVNPDDPVGELILRDTPLDAVLASLEQLTGRIVLRPQALPAPQITLNARALSRAEAIFAIETVLSLNGIGLVPADDKFLKVVPITSVRTEAPELFVGPLRDQPASGKVVSKLFRLQHIDTATFQQQVGQFLSGFGSIVPFQNSNAVIVTDTVANLQRLEYIVDEVDRQVSIETKFYPINYAKPSELAQQIRTMLDSARTSLQGTSGSGARGGVQPGQPGQPPTPATIPNAGAPDGSSSLQSVLSSNTSITPDDRTNQIIVITNPANLPFFDNLIAKLDVSADPLTSIEVIPMNYAKADELAGLLSDFIGGRSRGSSSDSRRDTGANRTRTSPFPDRSATNANRTGTQPDANPRAQAVQNAVNNAAGEEGASQFSDLVTINADERTNSIIVAGTTGDLVLLKRVISQLDVVLAQVRIDVLIAEVTLSDDLTRGIDAFNVHFEDTTNRLILTGLDVGGLAGSVTGTLSGYSLQDFTYDAAVSAARTNSNVNLLSSPNIVTTHNQPASIIVGEARPIISGYTSSLNTTGLQTQNVNYEDIALTLDVTPIIGPNDVVQLEIKQKVDDLGEDVQIGNDTQPVIIRREASSYVSVRSGEMIVIGGLTKSSVRRSKSKMFLLGEIPLIGEIFTRRINRDVKQELLVFLRPVVLRTTAEANINAEESVRRLDLNKQNVEVLKKVTGTDIGTPAETP